MSNVGAAAFASGRSYRWEHDWSEARTLTR